MPSGKISEDQLLSLRWELGGGLEKLSQLSRNVVLRHSRFKAYSDPVTGKYAVALPAWLY